MTLRNKFVRCWVGRGAVLASIAWAPSGAYAQFLQIDLSNDSVSIAANQHRFRGFSGSVLYTEQNGHQDLLGGLGYTVKSWLLGREQNFYISTGGTFYATDVLDSHVNTLSWHNVLRFEPRRWQAIEWTATLDYGPSFATFRDGESFWGTALQLDYRLSQRSNVIAGWRRVGVELISGNNVDIDRGGYVGMSWLF